MKKQKFNGETIAIFADWHNEVTCKMHDDIEELHELGAHSLANRKQMILDQLDEIAKYVGAID